MRPTLLPLLAFLTPLAFSLSTESKFSTQTLHLFHRFASTSHSPPAFVRRGVIHVDTLTDQAWLEESGTPVAELEMSEDEHMSYNLAIGRSAETKAEDLNSIALDSCVLFHATSTKYNETLSLFYTSLPRQDFIHFNFVTTSVEACAVGKPGRVPGQWVRSGNEGGMRIAVERSYVPDPVRYKELPPVVVDTEGKVVLPPKEKGFIEKYWIYALPVIAVLIIGGGGEEPAPAAAAAAK